MFPRKDQDYRKCESLERNVRSLRTVRIVGKPLFWAQDGITEDLPIPRLRETRGDGGCGGSSVVDSGANKGPGLTSGMACVRTEGPWAALGLAAGDGKAPCRPSGLAWLQLQHRLSRKDGAKRSGISG